RSLRSRFSTLAPSDPRPARLLPGVDDRFEDLAPLGVPEDLLGAPVGMRHQAEHVPRLVADSGDGAQGAVRIRLAGDGARGIAVAEDHLALLFDSAQDLLRRVVAPLAVPIRHLENRSRLEPRAPGRVLPLDPEVDIAADVLQPGVP